MSAALHLTYFMPRLFCLLLLSFSGALPAAEKRSPNIVFFLVDDLGQRDLGCYGSTFYETPNLDRLARQGIKFTDAYAACPVCSPSRASMMTGKYPQRTGITDYIGAAGPDQWKRNTKRLPAPYRDRLALEEITLAEALQSKGYGTLFAGKWHLGPDGFWPEQQGFDVNKGGTAQGSPNTGSKYFSPYHNPRLPDGPEGEHLPDRLAEETNRFIRENQDRPFFAYFSFYAVHTPLMAPPELVAKYEEKRRRLGVEARWGEEPPRQVRLVQEHVVYAGMVEAMDRAVGKVLKQLDELGLAENTVVIFTSDNGGLSTSEGSPTSNAPLRAGKGWMYEGGIREPLLVRWPGVIKAGTVTATPVSSPDFFPTVLEIAGSSASTAERAWDGESLLPVWKGGTLPERSLFWHYPHYGNQGSAPASAVRHGKWKLIEWLEDGKLELFNLEEDLGETNNLVASESALVTHLKRRLDEWRKQVGALMPVENPAYDPSKPDGRMAGANRKNQKKK
jgi:arylsulfatase A-like enzyme